MITNNSTIYNGNNHMNSTPYSFNSIMTSNYTWIITWTIFCAAFALLSLCINTRRSGFVRLRRAVLQILRKLCCLNDIDAGQRNRSTDLSQAQASAASRLNVKMTAQDWRELILVKLRNFTMELKLDDFKSVPQSLYNDCVRTCCSTSSDDSERETNNRKYHDDACKEECSIDLESGEHMAPTTTYSMVNIPLPGMSGEESNQCRYISTSNMDTMDCHNRDLSPVVSQKQKRHQQCSGFRRVPNDCAICLDEYYVGDRISWSSNSTCQHTFHEECIVSWLVAKKTSELSQHVSDLVHDQSHPFTCPFCRQNFIDLNNVNVADNKYEKEKSAVDLSTESESSREEEEYVQEESVVNTNTINAPIELSRRQNHQESDVVHNEDMEESNIGTSTVVSLNLLPSQDYEQVDLVDGAGIEEDDDDDEEDLEGNTIDTTTDISMQFSTRQDFRETESVHNFESEEDIEGSIVDTSNNVSLEQSNSVSGAESDDEKYDKELKRNSISTSTEVTVELPRCRTTEQTSSNDIEFEEGSHR